MSERHQPSYLSGDHGYLAAKQREDGGKIPLSQSVIYDSPDDATNAARRALDEHETEQSRLRKTLCILILLFMTGVTVVHGQSLISVLDRVKLSLQSQEAE